jgi:hypothetical protein
MLGSDISSRGPSRKSSSPTIKEIFREGAKQRVFMTCILPAAALRINAMDLTQSRLFLTV